MPLKNSSIVHPRLMVHIERHFQRQTGSIQVNTPTTSPTGMPVDNWNDVPGLANLPCTIAPLWAYERRQIDMTIIDTTHVVLLDGYYPEIQERHAFFSEGVRYDINGVESDSQRRTTRLRVRKVTL